MRRKMIRLAVVLAAVFVLMVVALAAMAQTTPETAGAGETGELADAIVTLGWMVTLVPVLKKVTERLVNWFAFLKGDLITLASVIVGWGVAYLFSLDPSTAIAEAIGRPLIPLPQLVLYLISGVFLAIGAGYLADREELKFGTLGGAQNTLT